MANLPAVCFITAAYKNDGDRVWEAMGRGTPTFTRKVCAIDPEATEDTPPTHYLMADSSAEDSDVYAWQAMANGDLPMISGVWGEDGIIDAASAMAATSGENLQVYSASGDVQPVQHVNGILASRGLQYVPDPI